MIIWLPAYDPFQSLHKIFTSGFITQQAISDIVDNQIDFCPQLLQPYTLSLALLPLPYNLVPMFSRFRSIYRIYINYPYLTSIFT